jgi:hypothetical protein
MCAEPNQPFSLEFMISSFCFQYKMWDIDPKDGTRTAWVAKFYKKRSVDKTFIFEDAKVSMIAQTYADDFNRNSGIKHIVAFVPSYVLELVERDSLLCCAEPILHGFYTKHNNNNGGIVTKRKVPQNLFILVLRS